MSVTKKDTQWAIESWFLVRRKWLLPLIPEQFIPYTRFGFGMISIGIWKHSNAYIGDKSYGPTLEAWVAIGLKYAGRLYGLVHTTYDNNPSYIEPIKEEFKFSKLYADMEWKERNGRHQLEVRAGKKLILRFAGSSSFLPASIPYSKPRPAWLIKNNEHYVADMKISALKPRLAFTSIDIPVDSPMRQVANSLKPIMKYSVFYQSASIEMPVPSKIEFAPK